MIFKSKHPEVLAKVTAACVKSLAEAGKLIETRAKFLCPVDTGNLRRSITSDVDGLTAEIGTNVHYAPHVEFGTRRSKAQPYLRPAGDNSRTDVENLFRRNLGAVK